MKKIILFVVLCIILSTYASAYELQRTFDKTTVAQGEMVTITYSQPEGQSYGLIQDVPSGWIADDLSADGKFRTYVDDGSDATFMLIAPSASTTSVFRGKYFVYPAVDYTDFTPVSITVGGGGPSGGGNGKSSVWIWVIGIAASLYFLFNR